MLLSSDELLLIVLLLFHVIRNGTVKNVFTIYLHIIYDIYLSQYIKNNIYLLFVEMDFKKDIVLAYFQDFLEDLLDLLGFFSSVTILL